MHNFILTGRRWPVAVLILSVIMMTAAVPALAMGRQTPLADPWVSSTADPLEGGSSLSIVTDGNNRPHISYFGVETADEGALFGLKYAHWNGASWDKTFIEPLGRTVAETSIALDSQGNPHISYYRAGTRDLRYAYFDEGIQDWVTGAVDETGDVGITNSLRLDSNDVPHIAYWDDTEQRVLYTYLDGTQWTPPSIVEDLTCGSPWDKRVSLALDSQNRPHVSYHDCALPSKLKYATQVSGNWDPIEVQAGNNSGLSSSIEVDSQDRPHISYRSGDTAGGLMYAHLAGNGWQFSPRIDDDFLWGKSSSLELDSGRSPRIAYTFWPVEAFPPEFSKEFRFAYLAGDQQTIEVIESADPTSEKAEIALALDSAGNYHVAYWDDITNQLKYAQRGALRQIVFLPYLLRN